MMAERASKVKGASEVARRCRLEKCTSTVLEIGTWPRFEVDLRYPLPPSAAAAFAFLGEAYVHRLPGFGG